MEIIEKIICIASPVEFINHTGRTINLKWLDYDGKAVIFATLERNNCLEVNTYVTHPWIALDEQTNETMLLNFRKTYFPDEPVIRRVDYEGRRFYAVRSQIHITTPVYRLEEYCVKFVRKIVLSQHINRLPLPQPILDEISQTAT